MNGCDGCQAVRGRPSCLGGFQARLELYLSFQFVPRSKHVSVIKTKDLKIQFVPHSKHLSRL